MPKFIPRLLAEYLTISSEEKPFLPLFEELFYLGPAVYHRYHYIPGHFTASAFIISPTASHALLIFHSKLQRWLQPGGHTDGDAELFKTALREAREETGLASLQPIHKGIFDLDIHTIPQNGTEPMHLHYDVRFLFTANPEEKGSINHESKNLGWFSLSELEKITGNNRSILRMAEKITS